MKYFFWLVICTVINILFMLYYSITKQPLPLSTALATTSIFVCWICIMYKGLKKIEEYKEEQMEEE